MFCLLSGNIPAHLFGETNFGENVEDEWFIVYILYELTRQFPGLIAKYVQNNTPQSKDAKYLFNGQKCLTWHLDLKDSFMFTKQ